MTHHDFGPELGHKPTTYTCRCGFRSTDYGEVTRHIADERKRLHEPRRVTTIPAVGESSTNGIEIASTPHGDEADAVEVRLIVSDGEPGRHRLHMVLMSRASIPFLIAELEDHRLDKDVDPCNACAAQAFAARLTDEAARTAHTCPASKDPA
jgi:hypothetical protein